MKSRQASAACDVHLRGCPRLAGRLHRLTGAQQGLRRDTRPVRALAPGQLPLDNRHPQPAIGQLTGAVLAGGTGADDDDVVVVAGHVVAPFESGRSARSRSATPAIMTSVSSPRPGSCPAAAGTRVGADRQWCGLLRSRPGAADRASGWPWPIPWPETRYGPRPLPPADTARAPTRRLQRGDGRRHAEPHRRRAPSGAGAPRSIEWQIGRRIRCPRDRRGRPRAGSAPRRPPACRDRRGGGSRRRRTHRPARRDRRDPVLARLAPVHWLEHHHRTPERRNDPPAISK